jgi:SAM-dependent methyltransferase
MIVKRLRSTAWKLRSAFAARCARLAERSQAAGILIRVIWLGRTYVRLWRNSRRLNRRLEIGPGAHPVPGFETLDCRPGPHVDYLWDCTKPLPFPNDTFEVVYASHVLEHIPWYRTEDVLREWVRVLRPGGRLEVWVPDGLKICQAWVAAELGRNDSFLCDGWWFQNSHRDPCLWASGRIYAYAKSHGSCSNGASDPNWHRAIFSERYLVMLFKRLALVNVRRMENAEVRGYDHGWINLGVVGVKSDNTGDADETPPSGASFASGHDPRGGCRSR